jgi:hypothetical protein
MKPALRWTSQQPSAHPLNSKSVSIARDDSGCPRRWLVRRVLLSGSGTGVMRDFRDVCEALEITDLSFEGSYLDSIGRTLPMFNLPKDLTTTSVSGHSILMRHKIVQRWLGLETVKPSFAIPTTLVEVLRVANPVSRNKLSFYKTFDLSINSLST